MINTDNLIKFMEGVPYDQNAFLSTVQDIVRLVIRRHFPVCDYEESFDLGTFKAVELLRAPYAKRDPRFIVNYLYTGIRNEIGNSLRRKKPYLTEGDLGEKAFKGVTEKAIGDSHVVTSDVFPIWIYLDSTVENYLALGVDLAERADKFKTELDYDESEPYFGELVRVAAWRSRH